MSCFDDLLLAFRVHPGYGMFCFRAVATTGRSGAFHGIAKGAQVLGMDSHVFV